MTSFNNHLFEFIDDIQSLFINDIAIDTTKNALLIIKKTNPRMLITMWHSYIALPYESNIENDDIDFFINKDYKEDLGNVSYQNEIIKHIDRLREPIRNMGKDNQQKSLLYIKNLTKLSKIYTTTN